MSTYMELLFVSATNIKISSNILFHCSWYIHVCIHTHNYMHAKARASTDNNEIHVHASYVQYIYASEVMF